MMMKLSIDKIRDQPMTSTKMLPSPANGAFRLKTHDGNNDVVSHCRYPVGLQPFEEHIRALRF